MSTRSKRGQSKDFSEDHTESSHNQDGAPTTGSIPISPGNADDIKSIIEETIINDKQLMSTIAEAVANCIKSQLEESPSMINSIVASICKSTTLVDQVSSQISDRVTQKVYSAVNMDLMSISGKVNKLQEQHSKLEKLHTSLDDKIDDLEQYSRRNCLLLHGVKEKTDENTNEQLIETINKSINLDTPITSNDIDRSHRLGRPKTNTDRPRPIIIKFCSYQKRNSVFKNKRQLKNTGKLITENLTVKRQALLAQASSLDTVEATWSIDGRIICLIKDNKRVTITKVEDLKKLK